MKYITTKNNNIIIFGKGLGHNEVASIHGVTPRGAGFINIETGKCYGESISLGIEVHEDDERTFRFHRDN